MARLKDIPSGEREMLKELPCPEFEDTPFVRIKKPLSQCRISLLSTAALQRRGEKLFWRGAVDYRVIPGDIEPNDIVMSHSSVNFDRTGFQQDLNICFPLERLQELVNRGVVGSVGAFHYSVIGGSEPEQLKPAALEIARMLKNDHVDVLFLVPI